MAHIQLISVAEAASPDGKIWKFPYALPVAIRGLVGTKHTFDVVDTHLNKLSYDDLFDYLKGCKAKIYGISAWSHNYLLVKHIIALIRENQPDSVIIVGGVLSGNSRALMEHTDVDIVATAAEGEMVLPEILDALDDSSKPLEDIAGLTYRDRKRDEVVITPKRPLMSREEFSHWSGQPIPYYEYFDKELHELAQNINSMKDVPAKGFPLVTMRGCPFKCTFCGFFTGQTFLRLSWPAFFDEIELLIDRYGIKDIYNYDTNMFLHEKDVNEFCDIYESRGHTFKSVFQLRPTFGDLEMFRRLKDHGVAVIQFGIEHGSQEMLDRMQKVYDVTVTKKTYQTALDADLMIHGNLIFGTPGECPRTMRESRHLMLALERGIHQQKKAYKAQGRYSTSGYGWTILIPAPPSELYEKAVSEGYIPNEDHYLESLADERNTRLLEGSKFKIALAHNGGDVNMSEFSSHNALLAYVHYNNAYIKLRASLFDKKAALSNIGQVLSPLKSLCGNYAKYLFYSAVDRLPIPVKWGSRKFQRGPSGTTQGSDWTKYHTARNDWPSPWEDAYTRENQNRGLIRLPFVRQK